MHEDKQGTAARASDMSLSSESAPVGAVPSPDGLAEGASELPAYASAVLDLVDLVPPRCATTYGDLAELVGQGGPRQPAAVLSRFGSATPWWRVVRADGTAPEHLASEALAHWRVEGMPTRETSRGVAVDLRRCRWSGPDEGGLSVPGGCL